VQRRAADISSDDITVVQKSVTKKLSYRKEIARELCTQYVEGIYSNSVTSKSELAVTRRH